MCDLLRAVAGCFSNGCLGGRARHTQKCVCLPSLSVCITTFIKTDQVVLVVLFCNREVHGALVEDLIIGAEEKVRATRLALYADHQALSWGPQSSCTTTLSHSWYALRVVPPVTALERHVLLRMSPGAGGYSYYT